MVRNHNRDFKSLRVRLILKSQIALYSVHIIIPNVHPFSQKIKQIKDTDVFTGLQYINVVRNSLQISDIFLEQSCCTPDFGTERELLLLIFHTKARVSWILYYHRPFSDVNQHCRFFML